MRSTYGFDPLGLGKDKASLERFQEAEVIHGRWAMLGVAGALGVEVLGFGNWYDAPTWVSRGMAHWARGGDRPQAWEDLMIPGPWVHAEIQPHT